MTKPDPEAPLDPNILIGTCVAERFELEEVIATGPASFVYRATDAREGGVVAVKLLLDDREYADVSTVKHPGFVRTLERGRTEQGVAFVVSELAEGRSVAELFASEPPSSDEAIRIVLEVGEALAAAHAAGVAHGSIKASEVMVGPSAVRILDLGGVPRVVARPSRTISARVRLMAHVLGGASEPSDDLPSEPAPPPQPRDDVYALGALLRQMLSESGAGEGGREPTVGVRVEPRMQAVLRTMLRALSKDVAARHADAGELVREIESASTASETPPPSTRRTAPAPIDAGALIGRTIGQRYRIERVIGRGSTAIVFQARHLELESKVALKVLAPVGMDDDEDDFGDRFRFEAQVLAELRHPNVIDVFDLGSTGDGLRYIAMELLDGETLAAMLKTRPRLAPALAVHIACQTAEALSALHERGLVHRDVKPANIFVSGIGPRPRVKLMDFGLARVVDSQALRAESEVAPQPSTGGPRRRQKTLEGIILGTAAYMSPELIQAKTLDARSDIYALAVVTYRMLTGTMPFSAEDLPHLLARHICEPAAALRSRAPDAEIPEALERAVLRGLEKNRELRPASALDFAEELRTGLVSSAVVEEPASSPAVAAAAAPPRKLRARGRMAAALAVVLGAITLIALFGARKAPQGAAARPEARESIRAAAPAPVPLPPAAPEPEPELELELDGVEETRPARAPSSRPVRSAASRPARAAPAKIDDLKRPAFKR